MHNLGDLAILLQGLEVERARREVIYVRRWSYLSKAIVTAVEEAGGTVISGRSPVSLLRLLGGVDMVIGGGQLVRDNSSPASLWMLLVSVCLVRIAGGQVETRGLGVSILHNRLHRFLWRCILKLSHEVRVRDKVSCRNVRDLIGTGNTIVTADMVFLPGSINEMFSRTETGGGNRVLIVQCIDPSENRSVEARSLPVLLGALNTELPHVPVNVVPHDCRPQMDLGTVGYMVENYETVQTIDMDPSLEGLARLYSRAALVITNRLHAIIFSILAGRPIIAIDDGTGKVTDIARMFDLPILSTKRNYTGEQVADILHAALNTDPIAWMEHKIALGRKAAANFT